MSVFKLDHAYQLADNAFRFRPDRFHSADEQKRLGEAHRPLVGKEQALLDALRAGEQRFSDCKAEIKVIRQLRKSDDELPQGCQDIANSLEKIIDSLTRLDRVSREELDSIVICQGSSFEEIRQNLEKALCWAKAGAEEVFPRRTKAAGRKAGVGNSGAQRVPLEEFAKEIRKFWLRETGLRFSFEATTRDDLDPVIVEPISAAARLLYDAARILDHRVEIADVEAVMRAANSKPGFREELLGDAAVDDLTS